MVECLLLNDAVEKSRSRDELEKRLRKHGVRIVFRKNALGNLMGVTLIVNAPRVVFKGSILGKMYSAKALSEALTEGGGKIPPSETGQVLSDDKYPLGWPENDPGAHNSDRITCLDLPVVETIIEILGYDEHESSEFVPHKKKRKKLQLSQ